MSYHDKLLISLDHSTFLIIAQKNSCVSFIHFLLGLCIFSSGQHLLQKFLIELFHPHNVCFLLYVYFEYCFWTHSQRSKNLFNESHDFMSNLLIYNPSLIMARVVFLYWKVVFRMTLQDICAGKSDNASISISLNGYWNTVPGTLWSHLL